MLVCVKCGSFLKTKKNGVAVEELMPQNAHWMSYKLWMADLVGCERCGTEVAVIGHSQHPVSEHYRDDYERMKEIYPPLVRVDDYPGIYSKERAEEYRARHADVPRLPG